MTMIVGYKKQEVWRHNSSSETLTGPAWLGSSALVGLSTRRHNNGDAPRIAMDREPL